MKEIKPIIAPILEDLNLVYRRTSHLKIATAFYTWKALETIPTGLDRLTFMCRLNVKAAAEWATGSIAPDALLRIAKRRIAEGTTVEILVKPLAHAKIYLGYQAALIGSANFTGRGFGGGDEILVSFREKKHLRSISRALTRYQDTFSAISIETLESYVKYYKPRRIPRDNEDKLPSFASSKRRDRFGSYSDFVNWLQTLSSDDANVIVRRAGGEGQLSGHIRHHFYGLCQFYVAHPKLRPKLQRLIDKEYRVRHDEETARYLKRFIVRGAVDEASFSARTWRNYMPDYLGGPPRGGGASIGNVNRMIPLVARYMRQSL